VITMEFPHLQRLIAENQFDTIYHEHFSYLSFAVVERIFGTMASRCSTSTSCRPTAVRCASTAAMQKTPRSP